MVPSRRAGLPSPSAPSPQLEGGDSHIVRSTEPQDGGGLGPADTGAQLRTQATLSVALGSREPTWSLGRAQTLPPAKSQGSQEAGKTQCVVRVLRRGCWWHKARRVSV